MKWWRAALIGLCLVALSGCGRQLTPQQAGALVQQIQQARRTLCLQGKLTTSIRVQGKEFRAEAEMTRGPGTVRLKYTSGRFAGWQIIEQDGFVWRVSDKGEPSASPIGPEAGLGLPTQEGLQIKQAGFARVAGRWAKRYVVLPPGQQTGKMTLVLDAETHYPLQMLRTGPTGQLVSATVYRRVQYGVPPPARLEPPAVAQRKGPGGSPGAGTATTEAALAKLLGGPLLKPSYVPRGLQLRGYYTRTVRRGTLAEIRYSDGLRTLVVAEIRVPRQRAGARPGAGTATGQQPGAWQRWQQHRGDKGDKTGKAGDRRQGWWQRRQQGSGLRAPEGQTGRGGRGLLRERRGDYVVVVGGDLAAEELRKVMDSVPYPPGAHKPGTKF